MPRVNPNLKKRIAKAKYFVLANGRSIRNVRELADVLEHLEEHVFAHHVGEGRNDFADWIRDVFQDVALARKLAHIKEKKKFRLEIYKHVTHTHFKR